MIRPVFPACWLPSWGHCLATSIDHTVSGLRSRQACRQPWRDDWDPDAMALRHFEARHGHIRKAPHHLRGRGRPLLRTLHKTSRRSVPRLSPPPLRSLVSQGIAQCLHRRVTQMMHRSRASQPSHHEKNASSRREHATRSAARVPGCQSSSLVGTAVARPCPPHARRGPRRPLLDLPADHAYGGSCPMHVPAPSSQAP